MTGPDDIHFDDSCIRLLRRSTSPNVQMKCRKLQRGPRIRESASSVLTLLETLRDGSGIAQSWAFSVGVVVRSIEVVWTKAAPFLRSYRRSAKPNWRCRSGETEDGVVDRGAGYRISAARAV